MTKSSTYHIYRTDRTETPDVEFTDHSGCIIYKKSDEKCEFVDIIIN